MPDENAIPTTSEEVVTPDEVTVEETVETPEAEEVTPEVEETPAVEEVTPEEPEAEASPEVEAESPELDCPPCKGLGLINPDSPRATRCEICQGTGHGQLPNTPDNWSNVPEVKG